MNLDASTFEIAIEIALLVFTAGGAWFELKALRKDISRLERKQEESNQVKLRTAVLESVKDVFEKRITVLEERMLLVLSEKNDKKD